MGLVPKASTKRNHASAYNRVINLARQKGYLGQGQSVPILDATGDRGEARPAFTREDINELLAYMPTWEQKGRLYWLMAALRSLVAIQSLPAMMEKSS
jgi:hypothetical protein